MTIASNVIEINTRLGTAISLMRSKMDGNGFPYYSFDDLITLINKFERGWKEYWFDYCDTSDDPSLRYSWSSGTLTYGTYDSYDVLLPSSGSVVTLKDKLPNHFKFSCTYYPTDRWEWLRFYLNGTEVARYSASYDAGSGSTARLTNLGYNKWVDIEFEWDNGLLTIRSGSNSGTSSAYSFQEPIQMGFMANRANNRFRDIDMEIFDD